MDEEKQTVDQRDQNKMGILPVKKLIISMSLPMMVSMLVQALYNIVDSIFVSRISEDALAAVTYAFPVQNLMLAVGAGTGVGINALLSRSLGQRNYKKSDAAANTGLLLAFCSALIFVLVAFFGVKGFMTTQTKDPEILRDGMNYLRVVCGWSFGIFFQITFERLLQATGRTVLSMISQMTGAIVNTVLDPILIFGLLGAPKLGVTGAALATVIGQTVAACVCLTLNLKKNTDIHYSLKGIFKPKLDVVKAIYGVGFPSILMMSIGSLMNYLLNQILNTFSSTAVAVFGVYFKLQSFFFMPVFGLNNGLIPVLSYNYGARKKERIDEALSFALRIAFYIMLLGSIVFELIPGPLLTIFQASGHMKEIGIPALRIIGVHFPIAALCIVLGSVFQAFAKSTYSLFVSLGRQLVVLIPAAYLLSLSGNLKLVWLAFPIAEVTSVCLSYYYYKKVRKEVIEPLAKSK